MIELLHHVKHFPIFIDLDSSVKIRLDCFSSSSQNPAEIMSTPITIKTATYQDAPSIAHIQVAGWRASYQGIVPEPHVETPSLSAKPAFW